MMLSDWKSLVSILYMTEKATSSRFVVYCRMLYSPLIQNSKKGKTCWAAIIAITASIICRRFVLVHSHLRKQTTILNFLALPLPCQRGPNPEAIKWCHHFVRATLDFKSIAISSIWDSTVINGKGTTNGQKKKTFDVYGRTSSLLLVFFFAKFASAPKKEKQ